jgi:hypothetical protein
MKKIIIKTPINGSTITGETTLFETIEDLKTEFDLSGEDDEEILNYIDEPEFIGFINTHTEEEYKEGRPTGFIQVYDYEIQE